MGNFPKTFDNVVTWIQAQTGEQATKLHESLQDLLKILESCHKFLAGKNPPSEKAILDAWEGIAKLNIDMGAWEKRIEKKEDTSAVTKIIIRNINHRIIKIKPLISPPADAKAVDNPLKTTKHAADAKAVDTPLRTTKNTSTASPAALTAVGGTMWAREREHTAPVAPPVPDTVAPPANGAASDSPSPG